MSLSMSGIDCLTHVWNPVVGCNRKCRGCWLPGLLKRIGRAIGCELCVRNVPHVHAERWQDAIRRKKPARIGVGFFTELFGNWLWPENTPIPHPHVWQTHHLALCLCDTIRAAEQHVFITPTSQPQNIPADLDPPDHWWLLVSVRDQKQANTRIPAALASPFKHVGLSYEPALGSLDLENVCEALSPVSFVRGTVLGDRSSYSFKPGRRNRGLDCVIAGGMSGPEAEPAHPDWFRKVRDQCQAAGVPFYFKGWGEWAPEAEVVRDYRGYKVYPCNVPDKNIVHLDDGTVMARVGKRWGGHLLDGREWRQLPAGLLLSGEENA